MKYFIRVGLVVTTLLLACTDERDPIPEAGVRADAGDAAALDAAVLDAAVIESDANIDVSMDAPVPDGYIDLFDVIPLPDAGCPGCIRDRCSAQINGCINNPACAAGLFCTLQMCAAGLGDSGFDPTTYACVLGCFNGDQNLAFMAIGSLTCVTMTCGSVCNFLDAGSDASPPSPDVQTPPEASADGAGPDAEPSDGDGATPNDDAAEDASGNDVTPETADPMDTAPPMDVMPDAVSPDQGGGAD